MLCPVSYFNFFFVTFVFCQQTDGSDEKVVGVDMLLLLFIINHTDYLFLLSTLVVLLKETFHGTDDHLPSFLAEW